MTTVFWIVMVIMMPLAPNPGAMGLDELCSQASSTAAIEMATSFIMSPGGPMPVVIYTCQEFKADEEVKPEPEKTSV